MLEKIKNLQWHYHLLLLVCVAALIYACVWNFYTSDMRTEVAALNDQVSQLQAKNETARVATQRINEFRALYASKSEEYEELKVLLPEQREITNVLQGLQDTANGSRMMVMRRSIGRARTSCTGRNRSADQIFKRRSKNERYL